MFDGFVPWPDDFARLYRERGYWEGVTLGEAFDHSVHENSDRIAVVDGRRRVTYRALSALVDRLALHLAEREIAGGKRVVFQLPNVLEFIVAYFACLGALCLFARVILNSKFEVRNPKLVWVSCFGH